MGVFRQPHVNSIFPESHETALSALFQDDEQAKGQEAMEWGKKILKVFKRTPEKEGTKTGVMKSAAQGVEEGIRSLFSEDPKPWKSGHKLRSKFLKDKGRNSLIAVEGVLFVAGTIQTKWVYVPVHILGVQKSIDEEGCPRNVGFHQDDPSFWSQDSIGLKKEKGGDL